jgi:hypothetical protein
VCHDFQILNQFTDLHENLYDPHITEGEPKVTYFSLLQLIKHMSDSRSSEVGAALHYLIMSPEIMHSN